MGEYKLGAIGDLISKDKPRKVPSSVEKSQSISSFLSVLIVIILIIGLIAAFIVGIRSHSFLVWLVVLISYALGTTGLWIVKCIILSLADINLTNHEILVALDSVKESLKQDEEEA